MTFGEQTTSTIPFNASAATVRNALIALPNVDPDDVEVSGTGPWDIVFRGRFAGEQIPGFLGDGSGLTGGGNPAVLVSATNRISQAREQIVVYFNDDNLLDDVTSAENPNFYRLIFTNDTARNTGGLNAAREDNLNVSLPTTVNYYPELDKAVLTFSAPIDQLSGAGTYRLRVGTDEVIPPAPTTTNIAGDPGSSFGTANNLGTLGTTARILNSSIDVQAFSLSFPGANDEPGHRNIPAPPQDHFLTGGGGNIQNYNFQDVIGTDLLGNTLHNAINDAQKQRAREIFGIYGYYLGIQFVETPSSGHLIATGDLIANGGTIASSPGGVAGLGGPGKVVMDIQDFTNPTDDRFGRAGSEWHSTRSDTLWVWATPTNYRLARFRGPVAVPNQIFRCANDIAHGRFISPPISKDIDLYQFDVAQEGLFTAEILAERLNTSSNLDSAVRLYRQNTDGTRAYIAKR